MIQIHFRVGDDGKLFAYASTDKAEEAVALLNAAINNGSVSVDVAPIKNLDKGKPPKRKAEKKRKQRLLSGEATWKRLKREATEARARRFLEAVKEYDDVGIRGRKATRMLGLHSNALGPVVRGLKTRANNLGIQLQDALFIGKGERGRGKLFRMGPKFEQLYGSYKQE